MLMTTLVRVTPSSSNDIGCVFCVHVNNVLISGSRDTHCCASVLTRGVLVQQYTSSLKRKTSHVIVSLTSVLEYKRLPCDGTIILIKSDGTQLLRVPLPRELCTKRCFRVNVHPHSFECGLGLGL